LGLRQTAIILNSEMNTHIHKTSHTAGTMRITER